MQTVKDISTNCEERLIENKGFLYRFGPYALYTVCFAVMFCLIFLFYIRAGKSFIQYGDGYRQGFFWMIEFRDTAENLLAGNGIDFWNWSAGLGRPSRISVLIDPFSWITLPFVDSHPELGYTISVVCQMYLAGIAFIMTARKFFIERTALVLGAVTYVFSSWVMNTVLIQGNFIQNFILFPLLILGIEKIYDNRSPLLFSIVVAYYLIRMPYFAYMAAIGCLIYIFVRYFARREEKGFIPFIKTIGTFIVYGIIGIMISMTILISSFYSLSGSSIGSGVAETGSLFSRAYYVNILPTLAGTGAIQANYMYLGLSSVIILLLACSIRRFSFRNSPLLMSIISVIFLLLPVFNRMFNGFSYPTGRWYFIMIFFFVLTAIDHLQHIKKGSKADIILMTAAFAAMAVSVYHKYWPNDITLSTIFRTTSSVNLFAIFINMLLAVVVILIICLWKNDSLSLGNNVVTMLLIFTMGATVLMWTPVETKKMKSFLRDGQIGFKLSQSVQRAGDDIEDDSFYRIDQVGGISVYKTLSKYANESLWWRTRSIYTYDSKVPSSLLHYNKLLGNNEDYVERVTLFSNDNRAGLDLMTGVKYFLGDDVVKGTRMSQYAGYGFGSWAEKDGVKILKNKYSFGLGTGFDAYITQEEFEKLSRLEREQALLQAAVVSDAESEDVIGLDEMDAEDIETSISQVPFTVTPGPGAQIADGKILITAKDAVITLRPSVSVTGQMMLSFDNLLKKNDNGFKSGPFSVECIAGGITKVMMNKLGNQGIGDITDYDVNLDYVTDYSGPITVKFKDTGEYTYDRLYLSAMDMNNYEKFASERQSEKYEITEFDNDTVNGWLNADDEEILYLSIPANLGWEIKVDGKKTHVIRDLNYAFTGVRVPKGKHSITLRYKVPGMNKGLMISCLGIILLIVFSLIRGIRFRRKRKEAMAVKEKIKADLRDDQKEAQDPAEMKIEEIISKE